MSNYLFTSESVAAGHPDKLADNISDAILDALIAETQEQGLPAEDVRCACETLVKTGVAIVAGEVRADVFVDVEQIVRDTVRDIGYVQHKVEHVKKHACREKDNDDGGYDNFGFGLNANTCAVMNMIGAQSTDIGQGVDPNKRRKKKIGAGDQGLMFGYACRETPELMPAPIQIAHELMRRHEKVRARKLPWLGPDAKAQVSMRYIDGKPAFVEGVVLSSQHDRAINTRETKVNDRGIESAILQHIIKPVLKGQWNMPSKDKIFINPTGRFIDGGPKADCGLTGRKIIVDTYGGAAPHGGGAFSGKDPTKVDRSAAYMMRYVAKNIVKARLAKKCLVQAAYAIGVSEPVSVMVNTYGTGTMADAKLERLVRRVFDLTPEGIIKTLDLWQPIYRETAAYGHFGRPDVDFSWEQTDMVAALKG